MRAAVTILAVVTLTIPALGLPFGQHSKNASPLQPQSGFVSQPYTLLAQANLANQGAGVKPRMHGPGPHMGDWLRQNSNLTPAQQEQKLENDPVFRSLTPDKQQKLLDRLHVFNSLSPEKKQKVLGRMETFEHLTPAQQTEAQNLYQRYRGLPPNQQTQVSQAYKQLRLMTPEQREQYFNSDEFKNGMNEEQRSLLHGMSELYPNPSK
jgi:hypothetical protein